VNATIKTIRHVLVLLALTAAPVLVGSAPAGAANGANIMITAMTAPTRRLVQGHPVVVTVAGVNHDVADGALEPNPAPGITIVAANCLTPHGGGANGVNCEVGLRNPGDHAKAFFTIEATPGTALHTAKFTVCPIDLVYGFNGRCRSITFSLH